MAAGPLQVAAQIAGARPLTIDIAKLQFEELFSGRARQLPYKPFPTTAILQRPPAPQLGAVAWWNPLWPALHLIAT